MGFGDFAFSAEMRDVFNRMIREAVDRLRPAYRYGVVQSMDHTTMKCNVLLNGDANPVGVSLSGTTPVVGQTVRVEGSGTDRFIGGVVPSIEKGHGSSGGAIRLARGTNLDDVVTPGDYMIDLNDTNYMENWPGSGIPTAATADAENPAGSFLTGRSGHLIVRKLDHRIIQTAHIYARISIAQDFVMTRFRWSGAWDPWVIQSGPVVASSGATLRDIGRMTSPGPRNPVTALRMDHWPPMAVTTVDSLTWFRADRGMEWSTSWASPSLENGWVNYGSGFESAGYVRTNAGIVTLKGLVKSGATNTTIFTLPPGYRPAMRMLFVTAGANNSTASRIDVLADGQVRWVTGPSNSAAHVSLASVQFPAADVAPNSAWTNIAYASGWVPYENDWPGGQYWQDSLGRVWFRGMVSRSSGVIPTAETQFGAIPASIAPPGQIHLLGASNGSYFFSLHVSAEGAMVFKPGGNANVNWLSLCNICILPATKFPPNSYTGVGLAGAWATYSASYPDAGYQRLPDGLVHWTGLVRSGTGTITQAPAAGWRKGRPTDVYPVVTNNTAGRVDAAANGSLSQIGGTNAWLSLDSIIYLAEG